MPDRQQIEDAAILRRPEHPGHGFVVERTDRHACKLQRLGLKQHVLSNVLLAFISSAESRYKGKE